MIRTALSVAVVATLAACGGGGSDHDDAFIPPPVVVAPTAFMTWVNSPAGEIVKDVRLQEFKMTNPAANGRPSCLFVPAQNMVVANFCQAGPAYPAFRYSFNGHLVDVRLARRNNGICDAALISVQSGRILELTVYATTVLWTDSATDAVEC